jgi:hypothetical protein
MVLESTKSGQKLCPNRLKDAKIAQKWSKMAENCPNRQQIRKTIGQRTCDRASPDLRKKFLSDLADFDLR